MDKLKALLAEICQLEEDYRENKRRLKEETEKYVTGLEKIDKNFIDFYYWKSGLPLEWIERQTGIKAQNFKHAIDGKEIIVPCSSCGSAVPVFVKSRAEAQNRYSKLLCSKCTRRGEEWKKRRQKQIAATYKKTIVREVIDLQAMTYAAYLQTPHWIETRKQALKRADYTCQKCGTKNVQLVVHHLTYERRGCELLTDLLVVCDPCHKRLHGIPLPQEKPEPKAKLIKKQESTVKKKPKKKLKTKKWNK